MNQTPFVTRLTLLLTLVIALSGCSESLDWREMKSEATPLVMSMPCRPAQLEREVVLLGRKLTMGMQACSVDGTTFSVASVAAGDPAQVGDVLGALRSAVVANFQAEVSQERAAVVPGMTPHASAKRLMLRGRTPDGRAVGVDLQLFSYGTRVFQVIVAGPALKPEVADLFMNALKVRA